MTEFTELMAGLARADDGWTTSVSDDWLQGRTTYGGLSAALCLQGALREFGELPPLRSAQFAFVGPAAGALQIRPTVLRKGKSTVFAGVDLFGEAGLATRATLCFGAARKSALAYRNIPAPAVPPPDACPSFFRHVQGLNFTSHFDGRLAGGHPPLSRAGEPEIVLWLRHRDPALQQDAVALLALADAPPPAGMVLFEARAPISTMTWSIDLLSDDMTTDGGWWMIRTSAETISEGYSSQAMTVWNAAGAPVMVCRQNIAVFI